MRKSKGTNGTTKKKLGSVIANFLILTSKDNSRKRKPARSKPNHNHHESAKIIKGKDGEKYAKCNCQLGVTFHPVVKVDGRYIIIFDKRIIPSYLNSPVD